MNLVGSKKKLLALVAAVEVVSVLAKSCSKNEEGDGSSDAECETERQEGAKLQRKITVVNPP
jgi:hypothetical protein